MSQHTIRELQHLQATVARSVGDPVAFGSDVMQAAPDLIGAIDAAIRYAAVRLLTPHHYKILHATNLRSKSFDDIVGELAKQLASGLALDAALDAAIEKAPTKQ
jgi:hypothetical protein